MLAEKPPYFWPVSRPASLCPPALCPVAIPQLLLGHNEPPAQRLCATTSYRRKLRSAPRARVGPLRDLTNPRTGLRRGGPCTTSMRLAPMRPRPRRSRMPCTADAAATADRRPIPPGRDLHEGANRPARRRRAPKRTDAVHRRTNSVRAAFCSPVHARTRDQPSSRRRGSRLPRWLATTDRAGRRDRSHRG
jgi:hypothetical protein